MSVRSKVSLMVSVPDKFGHRLQSKISSIVSVHDTFGLDNIFGGDLTVGNVTCINANNKHGLVHGSAAVCCSVLQCVAVCCSVLHCVAVSCSELQ